MSDTHPRQASQTRPARQLPCSKAVLVSCSVLALYALVAALGALGWLPDHQQRVAAPYQPPGMGFALWLGSDMFGRSVLFKLLSGTKVAIALACLVPALSVPLGLALGALGGYYGRSVDAAVVWLLAVVSSLPEVLLVLGASLVLGKGLLAIALAMAGAGWVPLGRLVRAEFIRHRDRDYVSAARLLGAGDARLICVHLLPSVRHLVWVAASLQALAAIKFEVVLTYLGVGMKDGASWGAMISDASSELVQGVWWPLASVVGAMFALIFALQVLSDALRDGAQLPRLDA